MASWRRIGTSLGGALALLGSLAPARAQRAIIEVPALIEFDLCILPDEACTERYDVVKLIVHGATVEGAITNLRVLTEGRTTGEVLSDLRFGPQRVLGPKEQLARFVPGSRFHVRATNRRGSRELFVQTVETRGAGAADGGPPRPPQPPRAPRPPQPPLEPQPPR